MINQINNGDSASEIRAKLNEMISIINDYSSSQYMDAGPGPDPGDAGGGADSFSIYSSSPTGIVAEIDPTSACSVHSTGSPQSIYIQKDAGNMGGTQVPEVNDFLYEDSMATMPAPDGYYAWYDMANMQNKAIQVSMGQISSIVNCA